MELSAISHRQYGGMMYLTIFIRHYVLSIFSASIAWRMTLAAIVYMSLCAWPQDMSVFAQTSRIEPDQIKDETVIHPQAIENQNTPDLNPPEKDEEKLKQRMVEPPSESSEGLGETIDQMHEKFFDIAQDQVEKVDSLLQSPGERRIPIKQPRFRLGLFIKEVKSGDDNFKLGQSISLDANMELPNLLHSLNLIVTTNDPTELPGRDVSEERDQTLRTALSKGWASDISSAVGVRARWKDPLFAYVSWSPSWKRGDWQLYPQEKIFWESRNGFGEVSTLVFDHWEKRRNTRFSTSVRWRKKDYDSDQNSNRKDHGFRWSEVFIFDHASELLDESQLGRVVSGEDIMRGWGTRLAMFGGFHFIDEYQAGLFYRFPLWKKWIYFLTQPEIDWKRQDNWKPQWTIKFGLDLLFWGGKDR
jgi:hypothetical protein